MGKPSFLWARFYFLTEQAALAVAENPSCAKLDLPMTWLEV